MDADKKELWVGPRSKEVMEWIEKQGLNYYITKGFEGSDVKYYVTVYWWNL